MLISFVGNRLRFRIRLGLLAHLGELGAEWMLPIVLDVERQ
ncbi:MAG: hypothetical protein WCO82_06855 [Sphingomonadales bacterium]